MWGLWDSGLCNATVVSAPTGVPSKAPMDAAVLPILTDCVTGKAGYVVGALHSSLGLP